MQYSQQEIQNIKRLAASKDIKNVCLAFEICKNRGVNSQLITAVYWMYNFFAWNEELTLRFECYDLIEAYWKPTHQIKTITGIFQTPFLDKPQLKIHHLFQLQSKKWQLDYQWLSDTIAQHFEIEKLDKFALGFLFKNCSISVREDLAQAALYINSAGLLCLDLGGYELEEIPHFLHKKNKIQSLKLWGNNLKKLPAIWDNFEELEELNLAENNLKKLPADFDQLQKLQRLYLNNNPWQDIEQLETILSQLPQLNFLSLSRKKNKKDAFLRLETLVNKEKLNSSKEEKNMLLALVLKDKKAIEKLKLADLFAALLDSNPEIQALAKEKIMQWHAPLFDGNFPVATTITVLGLVSFATRSQIDSYSNKNIRFSNEILPTTTHIVLGDEAEYAPILAEKKYIFLSEKALIKHLF